MPVSLNPLHYILAGMIALLLGVSTYAWITKTRLEVTSAQFDAFKANSDAVANAQKAKNLEEITKRDGITRKLTEDNDKLKTDLANKYTDYQRLLNSKARSGGMSSLSQATERVACPEADEGRLARGLERLESAVLERLAKSRDEAIETNLFCASWLNEQLKIVDSHIK